MAIPKSNSNEAINNDECSTNSEDNKNKDENNTVKKMGSKTEEPSAGLNKKLAIGIGIGVGATVGLVAAPLLIAGAGFGAGGVAASSIAAAWQSSIGSVAAGSLFASLQSAGAAGLGMAGFGAAAGVGAAAGCGAAFTGHHIQEKLKDNKYKEKLKEAFDHFDDDHDGLINFDHLSGLLHHLELESIIVTPELMEIYSEAEDKQSLGFAQFLKLVIEEDAKRIELKKTFDKFDADKDGFISYEELNSLLKSMKIEVNRIPSTLVEIYSEDATGKLLGFPQLVKLLFDEDCQRRKLKNAFNTFDDDEDGFITFEQFMALQWSLNLQMERSSAYALVKKYSEDKKEGLLGFSNFILLISDFKKRDTLKKSFDQYDKDKDGFITEDQLWLLQDFLKLEISSEKCLEVMYTYGNKNENLLGFSQFLKFMTDEKTPKKYFFW